jgi:hypothetical protein
MLELTDFLIDAGMQQVTRINENTVNLQCPFGENHKGGVDTNPSANVFLGNSGDYVFYCHSCGAKASLANLLLGKADFSKLEAPDKAKTKNTEVGLNTFEDLDEIFDSIFDCQEAVDYCKSRGISEATMLKAGLLVSQDLRKIIFPTYHDGVIVGLNHRDYYDSSDDDNEDNGFDLPKAGTITGTDKSFALGEGLLYDGCNVIIVEGLFDYLKCIDIGLNKKFVIIALCGTSFKQDTIDMMEAFNVKNIIFFTDNDVAGRKVFLDSGKATQIDTWGGYTNVLNRAKGNNRIIKIKKSLAEKLAWGVSLFVFDYNNSSSFLQELDIESVDDLQFKDPCDIINYISLSKGVFYELSTDAFLRNCFKLNTIIPEKELSSYFTTSAF